MALPLGGGRSGVVVFWACDRLVFVERREVGREVTERARELRRRATPWERILWKSLRKDELRWRRSHPLGGFFLDLYCDAARLAVEADGALHDAGYDAWRDRELSPLGILTIRFTNVEIGAEPEECLRRIREVAERRAAELRGSSDSS
jgi:very-short-patch-repair endonuclease